MILFDKIQAIWQDFQREYAGTYQETWISDAGGLELMHGIARVDGQSPNEVCIAVRVPELSPTFPNIYQGVPMQYVIKKQGEV